MKIRLLLLVLAIAAVAALAALIFHSRSERHSSSGSDGTTIGDRIKIEIRAKPIATITVDGKKVGTTPMSLQYRRSDRRVVIEATMVRHLVAARATKDETYQEARTITLDRDQLLDFTLATARLVNTEEKVREK